MNLLKISTVLWILPLTTKIFVQCVESVSKRSETIMMPSPQANNNKQLSIIPILRNEADAYANRFSNMSTWTPKNTGRTPPVRHSVSDECDYKISYCQKTYLTSAVCGRTLQYEYQSFKNYCMLDYVNCKEGHEIWQILHMGKCYKYKDITEYEHYQYQDDSFLSRDYVVDIYTWKVRDMPRYFQKANQYEYK